MSSPLWGYCEYNCCEHSFSSRFRDMFSFPMGKFLEAESLGRRIYIYLILKETASFLSGSAKVTRQMLHLLVEKKL